MFRRWAFAVPVLALLWTTAPAAQQNRAAARELVKQWQDAIVNVRIVLKIRMSAGGREMQSSDESAETVGTVIDSSGLTVVSLGSLNPGSMLNRVMGSGGGQDRIEFGTEPTDVKLRLPGGQEVPARIVLRDQDLDLAFLRPVAHPDSPMVAIDLQKSGRPELLDNVVILSRLGRVGGWVPLASLQTIGAIIERPRTFYVLDTVTSGAMGIPAFTTSGHVVGILTMRSVHTGRTGMFSLMGSTEGLGLLPVILPAEDIREIAKQAPDK